LRTDFILKSNIPSKVRKSQEKYKIMHKLNLCQQMFLIVGLKTCHKIASRFSIGEVVPTNRVWKNG